MDCSFWYYYFLIIKDIIPLSKWCTNIFWQTLYYKITCVEPTIKIIYTGLKANMLITDAVHEELQWNSSSISAESQQIFVPS